MFPDGPASSTPFHVPSPSQSSRRFPRIQKRGRLKNGTFILPATGERFRRQITLRNSTNFDAPSGDGFFSLEGFTSRRSEIQSGMFGRLLEHARVKQHSFRLWLQTPTARGIMKCSLAYLLGSCGTFLPPVAEFLGRQDGKHVVATIVVYFHPSRSAGSMLEATMLGFGAFLYATFIAISSMAVSVFFETQLGMIELAYAIVLIVFCGGGLGLVGWVKQKYNAPLVSVACSLASLAIITVLTKENAVHVGVFEDDKIVQVMKMVILGIISTSAVSLLIWPVSARAELRNSMIRATDSFGDMLAMITRGFLSGSELDLRSTAFDTAQSKYKSVFAKLTDNLKEAKLEHYVLGTEEEFRLENSLVNCMQRLAQAIGGLRSAAMTQFALLKESEGFSNSELVASQSQLLDAQGSPSCSRSGNRKDRFAALTAIEEASEEGSGGEDNRAEDSHYGQSSAQSTELNSDGSPDGSPATAIRTPADIFSRFISHLGPSMKSLAYSLTEILRELPFGNGPSYEIAINEHFVTSLTEALYMAPFIQLIATDITIRALYSNARAEALAQLYKSKELDRDRPENIEADFEEVAASCGHFSFSLQAFAGEMQTFLAILEELKERTNGSKSRSWRWILFWRKKKSDRWEDVNMNPEAEGLIESNDDAPRIPKIPKDDPALDRRDARRWKEISSDSKQGLYRRTLKVLRIFDRDDIRFALKVGMGAAFYALFAFIPATRPFYRHWRGEWGLLSYMLVCTITIGASNTTGWARFIGTFIGAVIAVAVWLMCHGNGFALAFCGWLVSLPCFYIIIAKGKGPFGRFIMLTYNLSCLYAYSLSIKDGDDDDDEGGTAPIITEIVLHRVVAVLGGVIWGMIVTRVIWPISARQKFTEGLSLLWLRMGLLWKRDPLSTLLEGVSSTSFMNSSEEFALQAYLLRLDGLRSAAVSEFELRGPFPASAYKRIMDATSKMLDAFHAMNVVMLKDINPSEGEISLLKFTADERAQLCTRISHLFQVLASSLRLEYPLNDALPSTSNPRDRLLAKIFQYRKQMTSRPLGGEGFAYAKDEDFQTLYAYTLVTGQLATQITKIEREIDVLFGVLDEDLFELQ